jgi:type II secretory pathway component PulJ
MSDLTKFDPDQVEWPGEPTHPSYSTAPGLDSAGNVSMELGDSYEVAPGAAYRALYEEVKKLDARNKALSEALDATLYERRAEARRVDTRQARIKELEAAYDTTERNLRTAHARIKELEKERDEYKLAADVEEALTAAEKVRIRNHRPRSTTPQPLLHRPRTEPGVRGDEPQPDQGRRTTTQHRTGGSVSIPDEALEAAKAASAAHLEGEADHEYGGYMCSECGWSLGDGSRENRADHHLREAIQAAAPIIRAQALAEAKARVEKLKYRRQSGNFDAGYNRAIDDALTAIDGSDDE